MPIFELSKKCRNCPEISQHLKYAFTDLGGIALDASGLPDSVFVGPTDTGVTCNGPREYEQNKYVCSARYLKIDSLDCDK